MASLFLSQLAHGKSLAKRSAISFLRMCPDPFGSMAGFSMWELDFYLWRLGVILWLETTVSYRKAQWYAFGCKADA